MNRELFGFLVEKMPGWASTPEGFKNFVVAADAFTFIGEGGEMPDYWELGGITEYGRRFAEIVHGELNINLGRYRNLDDLLGNCPAGNIEELVLRLIDEEKAMYSLDDELEALGMEPSEETMREYVYKDALVEMSVRRLSPYIDFV